MATWTVLTGQSNNGTAYDDKFNLTYSLSSNNGNTFVDGRAGYDVLTIYYPSTSYSEININPGGITSIKDLASPPPCIYNPCDNTPREYILYVEGVELIEFTDKSFEVDEPVNEAPENLVDGLKLNIESARHLYRSAGNSYKIPYYIDNKAAVYSDAIKIKKSERKYIEGEFEQLEYYTNLDFVRKKKPKQAVDSVFDVVKVSEYPDDPDLLGVMITTDWGNLATYSDISSKNARYQVLTHEVGHGVGLSHPFQQPTYSGYDHVDTVMSYNFVPDGSGDYWNGGYRYADLRASQEMWGATEQQINELGQYAFKNFEGERTSGTTFIIEDFEPETYQITSKRLGKNFALYWEDNIEKIMPLFTANDRELEMPLFVNMHKKQQKLDLSDWSGNYQRIILN